MADLVKSVTPRFQPTKARTKPQEVSTSDYQKVKSLLDEAMKELDTKCELIERLEQKYREQQERTEELEIELEQSKE